VPTQSTALNQNKKITKKTKIRNDKHEQLGEHVPTVYWWLGGTESFKPGMKQ